MLVSEALRINLSWLIRLRWCALLGQLLTILVVDRLMEVRLPLAPLLGLLGVGALTNVGAVVRVRGGRMVREWELAVLMGVDILVLTGLLYFTGGPFNPFSFMYLVHIALAAVVLGARWTWALMLVSLVCSGVLFVDHRELALAEAGHGEHMKLHLRGMWVAFGVAGAFIVHFLLRVTRALSAREAELEATRVATMRAGRLASLGTLAAGAAHELATPLSTIAVVARELERQLHGGAVEDVRLMRGEVDRCRAILDQMAAGAGQQAGEGLVQVALEELIEASLADLCGRPRVRVELEPAARGIRLCLPRRALAQALRRVVRNALEASPPGAEVVLGARAATGGVLVQVRDSGPGMPPEVLARVGEPFFTTKAPGRGMGLGLFLTRALLERLGGSFTLESAPGRGTVATLKLQTLPEGTAPTTGH
ncbi:MAG: ATP-binding protein [Myxococcota bacterium]